LSGVEYLIIFHKLAPLQANPPLGALARIRVVRDH
jgi:hypothetical protein